MTDQMDKTANKIINKYIDAEITEELTDIIMEDIIRAFGSDVPARVITDDELKTIEILLNDNLKQTRTYKVTTNG